MFYKKQNFLAFVETFERLYVPNQKNQQLLEQAANSIGAQACLSALGINYDVIEAPNTEWMSKNGHVPLLIGQNSARNVASGKIILSSSSVRDVSILGPRDIREMLTKIGISLRESDSAQRDLFKKGLNLFLTIIILHFF